MLMHIMRLWRCPAVIIRTLVDKQQYIIYECTAHRQNHGERCFAKIAMGPMTDFGVAKEKIGLHRSGKFTYCPYCVTGNMPAPQGGYRCRRQWWSTTWQLQPAVFNSRTIQSRPLPYEQFMEKITGRPCQTPPPPGMGDEGDEGDEDGRRIATSDEEAKMQDDSCESDEAAVVNFQKIFKRMKAIEDQNKEVLEGIGTIKAKLDQVLSQFEEILL